MPRVIVAIAAVSAAAALALVPGALGSSAGAARTADVAPILLRGQLPSGPWEKSLYLKLVKTRLTTFFLCGIYNHAPGTPFDCTTATGDLPEGTTLRLEQSPVGRGRREPDSPGWGLVGLSTDVTVATPGSNMLEANRRGRFRYRVTLRDGSGAIQATSNIFTITWHK